MKRREARLGGRTVGGDSATAAPCWPLSGGCRALGRLTAKLTKLQAPFEPREGKEDGRSSDTRMVSARYCGDPSNSHKDCLLQARQPMSFCSDAGRSTQRTARSGVKTGAPAAHRSISRPCVMLKLCFGASSNPSHGTGRSFRPLHREAPRRRIQRVLEATSCWDTVLGRRVQ